MWFYIRYLTRSMWNVARGPRHVPGRRFRVAVLNDFLRRTIRLAIRHDVARIRAQERPTLLLPSLRRRVRLRRPAPAGVDTLVAGPSRSVVRGHLLYLHGGGYNFCSTNTHRGLLAHIAAVCGVECWAPNYRLAPEHPFPAAIEDALEVYRSLLANGVDPGRLWIGGDSAGGGLSLATLLRLRDGGEPLPRGAVLISPWVDLSCGGESVTRNAPGDYLSLEVLRFFARSYLDGTPPDTPLASPLYADLRGLPPCLVQTGGAETLLSEGEELVRRARQAGVDVTYESWDGAIHAFQIFAPIIPEAAAAVRSIGAFLERTAPSGAKPAGGSPS